MYLQGKTTRIIAITVIIFVCCCLRAVPYLNDRGIHAFRQAISVERIDNRTVFFFPRMSLDKGIYTFRCIFITNVEMQMSVLEIVSSDTGHMLQQMSDPLSTGNQIRMMPLHIERGAGERTLRIHVAKDDVPARVVIRDYYVNHDENQAVFDIALVYRPMLSAVNAFLEALLFFTVFAASVLIIWYAVKTGNRIPLYLTLLILFISLPLFVGYLPCGHDTLFHVRRIANLSEELFSGRIPVRIAQTWKNGYGYPISIFYGDLFLIPAAVLFRAGVPLWRCYQFHTFLINVAAVLVSWYCFRIISGKEKVALLGSVLYAGSVRYAVNLYPRGAVGEESAMAVLPLVAAGFYLIFRETGEADYTDTGNAVVSASGDIRRGGILLTVGFSLLIQVHVLTTILATVFSVIFCLMSIPSLFREKRFLTLLRAAGLTLLINLWFIIPFVDYYARHTFYAKNTTPVSLTAVKLSELLVPDEVFYAIGIGTMLLFAACLVLRKGIPFRLVVLALVALWLGTEAFPWEWLENNLPVTYGIIGGRIQYVWRYFTIATLLICLMSMLHLRVAMKKATCIILGTIAVVSLIGSAQIMWQYVFPDPGKWYVTRAADVWNGDSGDALYMFEDVMWYERSPDAVTAQDGVLFTNVSHRGTTYEADCENTTREDAYIDFPVLHFYGYSANSSDGKLTISDGPDHRIRVMLPAGFAGHLHVGFHEPWYWRLSEVISLTVFAMIMMKTIRMKHTRTGTGHRERNAEE